jgi:ArsR family transcriptional regulator, arsenate/arsenite/antimonite-responsive transcriptional repressor
MDLIDSFSTKHRPFPDKQRETEISPLVTTKYFVTIDPVMKDLVTFSRALADSTRWRIVRLVMNDALCVCELADILEMPQSSVSSHVQIIRKAGLLESEKCEKWTYFQIHRDYRKLIQSLVKFFEQPSDSVLEADCIRCANRLAERESSCCPGPRVLAPKKSKSACK